MLSARQAFGHYEIIEKLGEGGMGIVYKARDVRLNRVVALKLLLREKVDDENQLRRFALEAHAASSLNHPNIVTVHDVASEGGTRYIAMEYIAGKTLDEVIPRKGMGISEALKIAIQIADAISAAAAADIVHRDLKPGNIMVTNTGLVKVLDFGLAKVVRSSISDDTLTYVQDEPPPKTTEGTLVGTVAYMSPEQAQGMPLDARSDIFSFGAVLYEMVTGQRAFRGETGISIISSILRDDPQPVSQLVPEVPRELETIVNRCLRKDPNRRFQTIADVRIALLELKEDSESGKLTSIQRSSKDRRTRTVPILWLSAAFLTALVAIAAALWVYSSSPSVRPEVRVIPFASYAGFQGYPAFSPDGNELAFTWTGGTGDVTHIFVKVIGTDTPLQLTSGNMSDSRPAFAPDGRSVAFLRELPQGVTGIYQVPPLGGRERLISQIPAALYQALTWSGDGKWLVTSGRSERDNRSRIYVVSVANGNARALSFGDTADEFYPALSRDSRQVVFSRMFGYSDWGIFVAPLDGNLQPSGPARQLNTPSGLNRQSAWSADGKDIVFANGGTATSHLWRVSVTRNTPAQQMLVPGEAVYQPAIAPVGDRLAFAHDFNNANIWSIPVTAHGKAGAHMQLTSSARSSYVRPNAFSSDGRKIAFESNRSGPYGVWTANGDGSAPAFLYGTTKINSGSPAWSRDGRRVAFDTSDGRHVQIYLISADGGSTRAVTQGQFDSMLPSWSHDGKWIYFDSNRTGRLEVFKCSPDGGEPVQVTHNGGWGTLESPDGQWLYYTRTRAVATPLLKIPSAGGQESEVLPSVHERWWAVAATGIWFMERAGTEVDPGLWSMESAVSQRASLRFLNFASGRISTVTEIPKSPAGGLALSPDGRTLLYSQVDHEAHEIALLENFR